MILFIGICLLGAFIGGFLASRDDWNDNFDITMFSFLGLVLSLIIAFPTTMLVGLIPGRVVEIRKEIVALQDNMTIEGSFFLGSGYIEGELYYFYMEKKADGGYTAQKVYADSHCTIYEDSSTPYVKFTHHRGFAEPWIGLTI